ncbi:MAG TPA: HAMP domain-containing sensor histidine kinase [Candidatus Limnocylindrales bacterium]|nr:HAMP domain-containing sensor histidine kinase [Candidatus Limnocylindrales bacterium]
MRRWPLSRKFLGLTALNVALVVLVLLVFARSQFRVGRESLLIGSARDRVTAIAGAFSMDCEAAPREQWPRILETYSRRYGAAFYLLSPRGDAIAGAQPEIPEPVQEKLHGDGRRPPPRDQVFVAVSEHPTVYWAGARMPTPDGEGRPALLLLRASSMFNPSLFFDWRQWLALAVAMVAACVLCWLPFVRGLTHSIAEMDRATAQIAQGRFDVHVDAARADELGHLGAQINGMSAQLESFVRNQKRFLGDIAHELCAPIARIQFALAILEQKAEESDRPHVAVLAEEVQEMSALVNELLSFSKAGIQGTAVPLSKVDVAAVTQKAVSREALAQAQIEVAVPKGLAAIANEAFLLRAVSNVLRNAIRYAGAAGPITISAEREGRHVAIAVADSGPGLPENELREVFAPFYRPESARTRETGGAGLGLAIVKSCVEVCRGTVVCKNREPRGLEVTIRLPAG